MKLEFFDGDMNILETMVIDTLDYWEACQTGFELMMEGRVPGAEDFKVYEKSAMF